MGRKSNDPEIFDDDLEFIKAVDKYKRYKKIKHMRITDYLKCLLSLGYRKNDDETERG